MVINIENAQNGFIVRGGDENPVVVSDFGQLVQVLVQAFDIQVSQAGEESASDEAAVVDAPEKDDAKPVKKAKK